MKRKVFWWTALTVSTAAAAATSAVNNSYDLDWLAPTLIGAGSLITSVVAAIIAFRASSKAEKADVAAVETHKLVNSRMDEMLKLAKAEAAATATAVAQESERRRTLENQQLLDQARAIADGPPPRRRSRSDASR